MGAGAWGTALAVLMARQGSDVALWSHRPEHAADLGTQRENARYLPGIRFPERLGVAAALDPALERCTDVLVATPFSALRTSLVRLAATAHAGRRVALACKGIEPGTLALAHEIAASELGPTVATAVLSGPTFAAEVARGLPAAMVVASHDPHFTHDLVQRLHGHSFRAYSSADVVGVEIGGAVKNVIAIATGIADGLAFGANTRAALITRGLAEVTRLGLAIGGRRDTFMGLAGLGDLVLTCTDDQSRNRRFGRRLVSGLAPVAAAAEIGLVEGVATARSTRTLAERLNVDMPITREVCRLLDGACTPRDTVEALLAREPRAES